MKFTESLKKNRQFRAVYKNGCSYANKLLVVYVLKNDSEINRLGLSVSRKVGNSVTRNRVSRLIKESYRLRESLVKPGFDIVVIARAESAGRAFDAVSGSLWGLLRRAGALRAEQDS